MGFRAYKGYRPVFEVASTEYDPSRENQFRQNLAFQFNQLVNHVESVAALRTNTASTAAFRHQLMLRRSS